MCAHDVSVTSLCFFSKASSPLVPNLDLPFCRFSIWSFCQSVQGQFDRVQGCMLLSRWASGQSSSSHFTGLAGDVVHICALMDTKYTAGEEEDSFWLPVDCESSVCQSLVAHLLYMWLHYCMSQCVLFPFSPICNRSEEGQRSGAAWPFTQSQWEHPFEAHCTWHWTEALVYVFHSLQTYADDKCTASARLIPLGTCCGSVCEKTSTLIMYAPDFIWFIDTFYVTLNWQQVISFWMRFSSVGYHSVHPPLWELTGQGQVQKRRCQYVVPSRSSRMSLRKWTGNEGHICRGSSFSTNLPGKLARRPLWYVYY